LTFVKTPNFVSRDCQLLLIWAKIVKSQDIGVFVVYHNLSDDLYVLDGNTFKIAFSVFFSWQIIKLKRKNKFTLFFCIQLRKRNYALPLILYGLMV